MERLNELKKLFTIFYILDNNGVCIDRILGSDVA